MTCSAGILANALKSSGGDITEALVRYNGGAGAWHAWRKGKPYKESKQYVKGVLAAYKGS